MCGIWTLIKKNYDKDDFIKLLGDFWYIKHRGPDNSQFISLDKAYIGFHRLSIVDTSFKSNQPFIIHEPDRTIMFICNGEIYNYRELDYIYDLNIENSDCMVIPKLYIKMGETKWLEFFSNQIKGEFAFIMFEFDKNKILTKYFVGRDMIGVRPLYKTVNNDNIEIYSSEIKGLMNYKDSICEFTPGTIQTTIVKNNIYNMSSFNFSSIYNKNYSIKLNEADGLQKVHKSVIDSITRRLLSDRPMGFLLSGGIDSSLIAAISSKILKEPIHTFCCGIAGSTDMKYAKMVADHIGSKHTEIYFTEQMGLDCIKDVIYTTETWDTTTIRASVGQYMVSRYIALNTDIKVVMVGEGPDEVCSSYLFNNYAPNAKALHDTAEEYVKNIHMYDGRRADRCISKWGLEARVPLLDPEFISAYWEIDPNLRLPSYNIEKYMLRKAFDNNNLLPKKVLWRKKEAFSDGISSKDKSWHTIIQNYINKKNCEIIIDKYTVLTKEASFYRAIFRSFFGLNRDNIIPNFWQPKWDKNCNEINQYVDPSARTLEIYN